LALAALALVVFGAYDSYPFGLQREQVDLVPSVKTAQKRANCDFPPSCVLPRPLSVYKHKTPELGFRNKTVILGFC